MTREELMEHLYRDGCTLESIGHLYYVSRERVRQILEKRGVPPGVGRVIRTQQNADKRWNLTRENKERKVQHFYGCSYDAALAINGGRNLSDSTAPALSFISQRRSSMSRGIEWNFTLPEWWAIWQSSGKWEQRGRGRKYYCMARINDSGPYQVGNVHIITNAQNVGDSYIAKPARARRAASHKDLTPRQKQIAVMSANGLKPADIAKELGIKTITVNVHLCSIRQKLGAYEHYYAKAA